MQNGVCRDGEMQLGIRHSVGSKEQRSSRAAQAQSRKDGHWRLRGSSAQCVHGVGSLAYYKKRMENEKKTGLNLKQKCVDH